MSEWHELDKLINQLEDSIEWRKEKGYKTEQLERWQSIAIDVSLNMDQERKAYDKQIKSLTNELLFYKDELYKSRIILAWLKNGPVGGSTQGFFERLSSWMDRESTLQFLEHEDNYRVEKGIQDFKVTIFKDNSDE